MEDLLRLLGDFAELAAVPMAVGLFGVCLGWWFFGRTEYERGREEVRVTLREVQTELSKSAMSLRDLEAERTRLGESHAQLVADSARKEEEFAATKRELESSEEHGQQLGEELTKVRALLGAKEKDLAQLRQEVARLTPLQERVRELELRRTQLEQDGERLRGELAAQARTHTDQAAAFGREIADQNRRLEESARQVEALTHERDEALAAATAPPQLPVDDGPATAARARVEELEGRLGGEEPTLERFRENAQEIEELVADREVVLDSPPALDESEIEAPEPEPAPKLERPARRRPIPADVAQRMLFGSSGSSGSDEGGSNGGDPEVENAAATSTPHARRPKKSAQPEREGSTASDALQSIPGIGAALEKKLHKAGIHSYRQIADWSSKDIDRMAAIIGTSAGKIRTENWVSKARKLAKHAK